MQTPYKFFLAHAGYNYDPKTETPIQGARRCARMLAKSEKHARDNGISFSWEIDQEIDSSDFDDSSDHWSLWVCTAYDANGKVCGSLSGIDLGRDGSPYGDPYKRVVEAQIACEVAA